MKIEVDPKLKASGARARKRRQKKTALRFGAVGAAVATLALGVVFLGGARDDADEIDGESEVFVQVDDALQEQVIVSAAGAEAFLNIRGEPMILTLPKGGALLANQRLVTSASLEAGRFPARTTLSVVDDNLLDSTQRVQLSIPSSSRDLAAFNARRNIDVFASSAPDQPAETSQAPVTHGDVVEVDDEGGSWGSVIGEEGADAATGRVSYVDTVIENTTTTAQVLKGAERPLLYRETLELLDETRALRDILLSHDVSEAEADRLLSKLKSEIELRDLDIEDLSKLPPQSLVAMRLDETRLDAAVLQISIYGPELYIITMSQQRPGRFVVGADPWFSHDLRREANKAIAARGSQGELRLKDAVYSTALRHQMPSDLVGELLVILARAQDLDQIANEKDRIRLLYSQDADGPPAGQIVYVALTGPDLDFKCYVAREERADAPFACFDPRKPARVSGRGGGAGMRAGFIVPVAGTQTSKFGPRFHPVLKKTVNHNGLDWGAPTGTPIVAAAAGRISRRDRSESYGNVVYIQHADGYETRYAHMNAFAEGLKKGDDVQTGQLIGYVGTTGRSTGPHLHFELRLNGAPVNPFGSSNQGSQSVEILVNKIIQVESAGNARAKNSRSSATGLGQFINSTWIRMMKTYRPDLYRSLDKQALLDLRFDPELSREMVTNLARENEAFLRSHGHQITPGRLYLAHFLGPGGADVALTQMRSRPSATVLEVMGPAVVGANPFLKGWTLSDMAAWAEKKMAQKGSVVVASKAQSGPSGVLSNKMKSYISAVDGLLEKI